MTNKEKFMEVMNQTFDAGFTENNLDITFGCPPVFEYKINCSQNMSCSKCKNWWNKEYKEVTQNDD